MLEFFNLQLSGFTVSRQEHTPSRAVFHDPQDGMSHVQHATDVDFGNLL